MAIRDLIPWRRQESGTDVAPATAVSPAGARDPIAQFRHRMDRLFDDFFSFPSLSWDLGGTLPAWPSMEVKENGEKVTVVAELAGFSARDVEVSVSDGVLTIRGERKSAGEDRDKGWSERFYGRFERSIVLPDGADDDKCEASFSDGILTVTMPLTESKRKVHRIPILNGSSNG
jgi:HSP20 family protein